MSKDNINKMVHSRNL